MNILELCFSTAWGGLEIYINTFVNEFRQRNHNIIGVVRLNSKLEEEFRRNNVEYISVNPKLKYLDFITAFEIKTKLHKKRVDIIHVHESKDLSTAILLKKLLKTPKIVFSQQMDSRYNKKDLFHRWIYKNIDQVVCMTENMKLNHLAHTPVKESQISTIYNGIDLKKFNSISTIDKSDLLLQNNIKSDKIIIGTVGRLDSLKNQELLIDAAAILINDKKLNLHFLIIGDETESITGKGYKRKLIEKSQQYGIEESISFIGFTKNIENYFDIMDIFVLPTDKESFGYVLIEAMAKGKPVIATNQGGPKEIIVENRNGYLIEPKNFIELSEKLSSLISDQELRIKMGQESKIITNEKFDVNVTIDNYIRLFNRVINSS
ncbi:MAG: glycosyltransferase family 4 protein [Ignavibacteriales bacterium]|nr:glycosyltransferase family 4 protein [Ignavibacteriales bacterium]